MTIRDLTIADLAGVRVLNDAEVRFVLEAEGWPADRRPLWRRALDQREAEADRELGQLIRKAGGGR